MDSIIPHRSILRNTLIHGTRHDRRPNGRRSRRYANNKRIPTTIRNSSANRSNHAIPNSNTKRPNKPLDKHNPRHSLYRIQRHRSKGLHRKTNRLRNTPDTRRNGSHSTHRLVRMEVVQTRKMTKNLKRREHTSSILTANNLFSNPPKLNPNQKCKPATSSN